MKKIIRIISLSFVVGALFSPLAFGQSIQFKPPKTQQQAIDALSASLQGQDKSQQKKLAKRFLGNYFTPWKIMQPGFHQRLRDKVQGKVDSLQQRASWDAHNKPHQTAWWQQLKTNMNLSALDDDTQKAIVVNNSFLRMIPTRSPIFNDVQKPEQGRPMDSNRQSNLWIGTPVRIVHTSKDDAWVLVQTPWSYGWLPVNDIAYVDKTFIKQWRKQMFVAVTKNNQSVYDTNGEFRFKTHRGMLFPLDAYGKDGYQVLIPLENAKRQAVIGSGAIHMFYASVFPNYSL